MHHQDPDLSELPAHGGSAVVRLARGAVLVASAGALTVATACYLGAAQSAQAGTPPVSCPPTAASPKLTKWTEQLPVPPRLDRTTGGTATLVMKGGTHTFHAALPPTPTLGYATSSTQSDVYGGPTIEAERGVPLSIAVTNSLGTHPLGTYMDHTFMGMTASDETAPRGVIHLHGAHTEPSQDGLPADTITPGSSTSYAYVNDQEATGLWYHDHAWGMTRLQVSAGLAGQYWLRDSYDTGRTGNPEGLPSGAYELPLTLQDRTFNADGSFSYPVGAFCGQSEPAGYPDQWSPESFGDVAVVNGKAWPNLTVDRGVYRFRVLNASNARFYNLSLGGQTFYQVGSDGGLLNKPVPVTQLLLAPAERADLLIDFRNLAAGTKLALTNNAVAPYPSGAHSGHLGGSLLSQVMQFTVGTGTGFQGGIPATLRGGKGQPPVLPTLTATTRRTVMLNEIADPALDEPVHGHIDNQFYADSSMQPRTTRIQTPKLNSVEEWDIVNTTGDAHPIHLHLTQFRLLNRQGFDTAAYTAAVNSHLPAPGLPDPSVSGQGPWPAVGPQPYLQGTPTPPAANEQGWKDTVVAPPGMVTRIIVPFGGTAAGIPAPFTGDSSTASVQRFAGTYVFHCHILEHEDNDMMQPYAVQR